VLDVLFGTLIVFGVAVALMSVGLIGGGRELRGSCGGPNADCPCSEADKKACANRGSS